MDNLISEYGFINFKKFWDSEVEKKLFRCSKEYGIYNQIKKVLNPSHKRYRDDALKKIFNELVLDLYFHPCGIIDFSSKNYKLINRKFTVSTAIYSKRHLSQLIVFKILEKTYINDEKFLDVFRKMDRQLYKNHKLSTFIIEKWYFFKLFLSK